MAWSKTAAFACVAGLLTITGCANVDVAPVRAADQHGVRYWRPAPYISLQPNMANGTTTCDAKLVMLPDKQEEYAITMNTGLWGSAEANPTLQDGWNLTSLSGKADSKTAETLASFASFIKALPITPATAKLVNKPSAGRTVPACEGFYRLDYDQSGALRGFTYFHLPVRYVVRSAPTPTPSPPKADDKNCGKGGNPPCTK